jgi:DNA-3-methyladenine glycosylase I
MKRCSWVGEDPLMIEYHDKEWGTPLHDDRLLFELLCLEGAQAGLSWMTILRKRSNYRMAFDDFDPAKVADYDERRIEKLLANPGIVRNRRKILSAVSNAQAFLGVQREFGSFDAYIWQFVEGRPMINEWRKMHEIPAATSQSMTMSRDLLQRGFIFVGPTICYAFMQTVGMVNDHTTDCFRHSITGS